MAITRAFAVFAGDDTSGTGLTSGTFDSTGYTHLVAFLKHEGASTTQTASDNKGSGTWTKLTYTSHGSGDLHGELHYVKIGTPGTGHTVTLTLAAARAYRRLGVWKINCDTGEMALAHATVANAEANATGTGTAIDAGTLTTDAAAVLVMAVGEYTNPITWTVGTGWTADWNNPSSFISFGQGRTEPTSGTFDPSCSQSASTDWIACSAAFKEASGGGGGSPGTPTTYLKNQLTRSYRPRPFAPGRGR